MVDMEERPVKNLHLSGCMVNRVRFDTLRSRINFTRCQIIRLEGVAGSLDLPKNFDSCDVAEFDDRQTNAAIVRSELQDSIKVLLVIIRKLFLQRGSGRVESALSRGVNESLQVYVNPVRNLLVSEGIVYSHVTGQRTIWHGNRTFRSRMLKILERPSDPDDPLAGCGKTLLSTQGRKLSDDKRRPIACSERINRIGLSHAECRRDS